MPQPLLFSWQETRRFKFGATIGALVLTCAGAGWGFDALAVHHDTPPWIFVAFSIPAITLGIFTASRFFALMRWPKPQMSQQDSAKIGRHARKVGIWFGVICTAEGLAIAGASAVLNHAHQPQLVSVAIAAIVGLHLVPLGKLFGIKVYEMAGWLIVVNAGLSLLIANEKTRIFEIEMVTALLLWMSACRVIAVYTLTAARAVKESPIRAES